MILSMRTTAVWCGGAAGAACRHALGLWAGTGGFPFGILAVNTLGCLLMGLLQGFLRRTGRPSGAGYGLLGTGFLGGFTTFSSFALDTFLLARSGHAGLAGANVALNLGLGVGAVWAGYTAVIRVPTGKRAHAPAEEAALSKAP